MDMNIRLILVPIIGALIGYGTNWIAVKMLFRPYTQKRVFGFRIPFTPGVIPKGQGRLAKAVGKAVETQLLTKEVLTEVLLSDEVKKKIADAISTWEEKQKSSTKSIKELALLHMDEERYEDLTESMEEQLSEYLYEKITEINVGKMISEKVMDAAKEKLAESMFGMMLGGSFLEPIAEAIEEKINEYITDNGRSYLENIVMQESGKLQDKTMEEIFGFLSEHDISFCDIGVGVYENIIKEKISDILTALKLSKIVEDRINSMKVEEVEELLLSIMKKELGAVVNLGALIGFILGLINVAILCL